MADQQVQIDQAHQLRPGPADVFGEGRLDQADQEGRARVQAPMPCWTDGAASRGMASSPRLRPGRMQSPVQVNLDLVSDQVRLVAEVGSSRAWRRNPAWIRAVMAGSR